jgi:hypothetical protein
MSQNVPESFEVLSHFVTRFIKACVQAPHSAKASADYLEMIDEVKSNPDRLKAVLEIIGKDIFLILSKIPVEKGEHKSIELEFDYEPEVHESMVSDWLLAISEDEADEFYGLIELLAEEDSDTIQGFLLVLMAFYTMFIQNHT